MGVWLGGLVWQGNLLWGKGVGSKPQNPPPTREPVLSVQLSLGRQGVKGVCSGGGGRGRWQGKGRGWKVWQVVWGLGRWW